jgi:diguanylate cyclase (GGDEF)-like protein
LLVDWLEDDYQNIVLRGAVDAARERGVGLVCFAGGSLGPSKSGPRFGAPRNAVFGLANSRNVDGLMVLSGTLANHVGRQELLRFCDGYRPLPMCSIAVALPTMPSVLVDNAAGMRAAIVHLIVDHQLKRIAFLRGPPANDDAERRYRIYCDVLSEYGLSVDPRLVVSGDFQRAAGVLAIRELFDNRRVKCDAVVAASDYMALGAIEEATARGIRVPEDLAVVGFDDVEEASCSSPPLTTVRQPLFDQGRWAVEVLLDLIRGRPTPDRIQLHTEFVRRSSCGCPAGDDRPEAAVLQQARQRLASRRWARALAETGEALLSTPDVPGLAKTVADQLPALGIESGYLALYENGERPAPVSKLILGYDRANAVLDGRVFHSEELIPSDLAGAAKTRPYVVEPLFFKDEELGFAVLELGHTEGVIYEALRDQVSGALKSALLLEQVIQTDRERRRLLRYIVSATPDMHRMQTLDELFHTILIRITELFGSVDGPPSEPDRRGKGRRIEGFLAAVVDDSELTVRASTDRFVASRRVEECVPPEVESALRESLRIGEIRVVEDATLVPLRVSDLPLGVIYLDRPILSDGDVELLKVFSNQATAAVRNAQLYEMAALDPLTGAYARRFFSDWLHREVRTAFRTRHELSLLMVDVDNMKRINDAAGHLLGDQALSLTAKALRQATREGDVVGRYGGDEFSVVLPHTDAAGAALVAERALKLIESKCLEGPNGEPISVQCSIGQSTLLPHDFALAEGQRAGLPAYFREVGIGLIKSADEALYRAKRSGGHTVESGVTAAWPPLEG